MPLKRPSRERILVRLNFGLVPVQASLGVLGRRWALRVLMTIALGQAQRFNRILRATPGMSKRILAMRLRELEREGFLTRAGEDAGWELTQKGADILPVVLTLIQFSSKWRAPGGPAARDRTTVHDAFAVSYVGGRGRNRPEASRTTGREGDAGTGI